MAFVLARPLYKKKEIMKIVTYTLLDGSKKTIEYDETLPCWMCEQPVVEASMGGTVICPACDCGINRQTHEKWTFEEAMQAYENYRKNAAKAAKKQHQDSGDECACEDCKK